MSDLITYDDKIRLKSQNVSDKYKVTAEDMNEIKEVVNNNATEGVSVGAEAPTDGRRVWFEKGKNLFDGQLELGMYDETGAKATNNTNYRNVAPINVQPITTYTFSINGTSQKYVVYFYKKDGTFISANASLTSGTFTTPAETYLLNFRCFNADFTSDYANLKIQLEKGSTATSYEPYIEQSIKVDNEDFISMSNLVSVGIIQPSDEKRIWFRKSKNLLDEKTLRQGSGYDPTTVNRVFFPSNYYLEPGTYTLYTNLDTTNYKYAVGISSNAYPNPTSYVYDSGWQTLDHVTFTLSQSGYLGVGVAKSDGTSGLTPSDISNYHFMLYKGSYDSTFPYEPYVEEGIYIDEEELHFDNYSTDEQVIGKWIDGKPIYRKTYQVTNISSSNADLVDVSGLNIDTVVKLYGFIRSQVNMCMPMPLTDSSTNYNVIFLSVNKIRGRVAFGTGGSLKDCYVTIEYTKN